MNESGFDADNDQMCDGRDLPWLQETDEEVWDGWGVVYRDVWVLDADNDVVGVFNLTGTSLGEPANYAALRALFELAAR